MGQNKAIYLTRKFLNSLSIMLIWVSLSGGLLNILKDNPLIGGLFLLACIAIIVLMIEGSIYARIESKPFQRPSFYIILILLAAILFNEASTLTFVLRPTLFETFWYYAALSTIYIIFLLWTSWQLITILRTNA
jgi:hypothetical protein